MAFRQELFDHMHAEHGLILLQEEMQEIVNVVHKVESNHEIWRWCMRCEKWFDARANGSFNCPHCGDNCNE